VLDDLIRTALNEAAVECVVPEAVDQHVWSCIIQGEEPEVGGASDEQ
jgi:hypothetical protein